MTAAPANGQPGQGDLHETRSSPAAALLLQSGAVLIAGGAGADGAALDTAEIDHP